jgi:hypothetical protein
MWFAVVCPADRRTGCGASRRGMFKAPTRLAAPVNMRPVADAARATSADVGPGGGTLSATAANGTTFRLEIPAGSLATATRITLTPLSALTSAKWFGKLVGGVQLAPEGLLLMRGATLTVTPKRRVPVHNWVPVGFAGDGLDVHLVPIARSRSVIRFPLSHFSGFGVGNSSSGGAGAPSGGTASGFFEGELMELMKRMQDGTTSEKDFNEAVKKVFEEWYRRILASEVPPGLNEDNAARTAIKSLLRWAYVAQMFSFPNAMGRAQPTIVALLEGIYRRAQEKCAGEHDLTQVPKILDTDRQLEIMGAGHGLEEDMKCMRFTVEFDSTMTITDTVTLTSGAFNLQYVAIPTIRYGAGGLISGEAPGSYPQASGTLRDPEDEDAWWSVLSGSGGTVGIEKFDIDPQGSGPAMLVLGIGGSPPVENYKTKEGGGPGGLWFTSWMKRHEGEHAAGRFFLSLERGYPSSTLIARRSWSGTASLEGGLEARESTTIEVYHAPESGA